MYHYIIFCYSGTFLSNFTILPSLLFLLRNEDKNICISPCNILILNPNSEIPGCPVLYNILYSVIVNVTHDNNYHV